MSAEDELQRISKELAEVRALQNEILDLVMTLKKPSEANRQAFIDRYLEGNRGICYALATGEPEGAALFKGSLSFHNAITPMVAVRGLKVEKIENDKYYYLPDYDIKAVRDNAKYRKYRPSDPKLVKMIAERVLSMDQLNLRRFLQHNFPGKGSIWINEAIEALVKSSYRLVRDVDNPDVFRAKDYNARSVAPSIEELHTRKIKNAVAKVREYVLKHGQGGLEEIAALFEVSTDDPLLDEIGAALDAKLINDVKYSAHIVKSPGSWDGLTRKDAPRPKVEPAGPPAEGQPDVEGGA